MELRGNKLKSAAGITSQAVKELYLVRCFCNISQVVEADNEIQSVRELELLTNLEILHLRNNQLSLLDGVEHLSSLSYLNLRYLMITTMTNSRDNAIKNFSALEKLKLLTNLRTLILTGNPVTKEHLYRTEVLIILPQLQRLDKNKFEEEDFEEAKDLQEERRVQAEAAENAKRAAELAKQQQILEDSEVSETDKQESTSIEEEGEEEEEEEEED